MTELGANPEPFTVSVNVADCDATLAGLSVEIPGTGKLITPPQELKSKIPITTAPVPSFERKLNPFLLPQYTQATSKTANRKSTKDDEIGQLGCLTFSSAGADILPAILDFIFLSHSLDFQLFLLTGCSHEL